MRLFLLPPRLEKTLEISSCVEGRPRFDLPPLGHTTGCPRRRFSRGNPHVVGPGTCKLLRGEMAILEIYVHTSFHFVSLANRNRLEIIQTYATRTPDITPQTVKQQGPTNDGSNSRYITRTYHQNLSPSRGNECSTFNVGSRPGLMIPKIRSNFHSFPSNFDILADPNRYPAGPSKAYPELRILQHLSYIAGSFELIFLELGLSNGVRNWFHSSVAVRHFWSYHRILRIFTQWPWPEGAFFVI